MPDVELQDGDLIQLGNTTIRCVLTPGHTIGDVPDASGRPGHHPRGDLRRGWLVSVSEAALRRNGMPLSPAGFSLPSIKWDEPVDLMLGNHPFHNDTRNTPGCARETRTRF